MLCWYLFACPQSAIGNPQSAISMFFVRVAVGGTVGGEDDLVRPQGVGQAGQRHFLAGTERGEEGLELRLIRMIGDIAGVEQLHGQITPLRLVQRAELRRMKLVVEQAAFAADEVDVEIVRLQTINRRRALAHAPVLEPKYG